MDTTSLPEPVHGGAVWVSEHWLIWLGTPPMSAPPPLLYETTSPVWRPLFVTLIVLCDESTELITYVGGVVPPSGVSVAVIEIKPPAFTDEDAPKYAFTVGESVM